MTLTIQEAINNLIADVPGAPFSETVYVVKVGDPSQPLRGIVTTFLANYDIIEQAAQRNANLIICHEPLFYNHLDQTDWLQNSDVYQAKRKKIEELALVVWRFHDYMHSIRPDPLSEAFVEALSWRPYFKTGDLVGKIPLMKFGDLVSHVKTSLNVKTVRVIGDLDMSCQTIAAIVGFPRPVMQIGIFAEPDVDVIICGEIHEWEISEFARDAQSLHRNKALIVCGHAASEEPGMRAIIPWIQQRLPDTPTEFIPTRNPFQYL